MSSWHGYRHRRSSVLLYRRTKQTRKCCSLTKKDIFRILSSLALPLMLGIFTVVLSFDQKNLATKQRLEDRRLADEQREQDLNISHEQRREDRELAREHRLQDLNQSILQRTLERMIADETRNISEQTRIHQFEIEDKRYRDVLLTNYINQMSDLLKEINGSITNNSLLRTLIRLKTLTLLRQLDSNRNSEVIRFLYEANLLSSHEKSPIDLYTGELLSIDMSSKIIGEKMHNLYLSGADLTGSSFRNRDLTGTNFSGAILTDVDFSFTKLTNTDLSYTKFNGSFKLYKTDLRKINLAYANLMGIDFTDILSKPSNVNQLDSYRSVIYVNFTNANLINTRFCEVSFSSVHFGGELRFIDFSNTSWMNVILQSVSGTHLNFAYSYFVHNVTFVDVESIRNASFFMAKLNYVIFSDENHRSYLQNITFDFAQLKNVTFLGTNIIYSSFVNVTIINSSFDINHLYNSTFINAIMSQVTFSVTMRYVIFDNVIFNNSIIFSKGSYIFRSSFRQAHMQNIIADQCEFLSIDMNRVNLTNSTMFASHLSMSNLINSDFTGVNLLMANLSHSNLFNACITDEQLYSAISIENTILPNGTIAYDIPLIRNGNADCHKRVEEDWNVEPSNSILLTKLMNDNHSANRDVDCMFVANRSLIKNNSLKNVTMSQRIDVTRYRSIFLHELAVLQIISDCNQYVDIIVIERNEDNKILNVWTLQKQGYNSYPESETTNIEIKLQFDMNDNKTAMCDNIRFYIKLRCYLCVDSS
ncbi:unnamed protein product [Adineta steineri]|uniref:Pentapeptide repeat-containing protein n=1 Tax=Adineta steineri TaxID=433720 RepID=A0A815EMH9_9BILA|nr:unnamed protein product [Adineta steineri]CAF1307373.1 unnamed protein product [Adineta steineri]CAF1308459.1 unnamed protein product [Adineta steineri]